MRLNYIFNFSFVSNENESYFTYSLYNSSIISRLLIDVTGQIKQMTSLENAQQWNLFWSQPRQQCEVYAFCGAFGSCTENSMPYCNCFPGFEPKSLSDWHLEDHSDHKTKKPQYLTSWQNTEDPATGLFSLAVSYTHLEVYKRQRLEWTYFQFGSRDEIKQMTSLENAQQWNLFWSQPRQQCEVYAFCGAFGSCTENSMPYCNCFPGFEPKSLSDWHLEDHSDHKTKKPQYLTSWQNTEDPATGLFSLAVSYTHLEVYKRQRLEWTYFQFGSRDEIKQMTSLENAQQWNLFWSQPRQQCEVYAFCGAFGSCTENSMPYCNCFPGFEPKSLSDWHLEDHSDVTGQIKQMTSLENAQQWNLFWSQPRQQCEVYAFCGAFGSCTENSMPYCNCFPGFEPKSLSDWHLEDHSGGWERRTKLQLSLIHV
ncbi:hypothetical protein DEO72_LG10g820 [Vigna unguiculata]|uniref:S-locus glycoprotein domain-containing protein n=1 Tax=Vigna unguiculata TaxID=3917 RepID=A0A4D6NAP0_VIGUN|nr:hypothetical protein DEO72_LG10g820 [Vigna unguiculata]